MSNISEKKEGSKKRKFSERLEIVTEFKGLNSLIINEEQNKKMLKIDFDDKKSSNTLLNIIEEINSNLNNNEKFSKHLRKDMKSEKVNDESFENINDECNTNLSKKDEKKKNNDNLNEKISVEIKEEQIIEEINTNQNNKVSLNKRFKKNKDCEKVDVEIIERNNTDEKFKINKDIKNNSNIHHPKNKTFILLENIDESVTKDDLDSYLKINGINVDRLSVVPGPLAMVFFNREKDLDRLFNICQGIYFKNNELLLVKSLLEAPQDESTVTNMSHLSIHIKNLDVTTTEEDISSLIEDMSKVRTITLNSEKRTAIIDCTDSNFAQECIVKLDKYRLGERILQASFLVKTLRPDHFVLKVSNLPYGFNKVNIQESFPTAWKIKIIQGQRKYCHLHFKTIEDFEAVLNCLDGYLVKGVPVVVEEISKTSKNVEKKDNFILNVFNLPFDMTLQEIKEQYPRVRYIEMLKNPDGLFMGSAKLNFDEKEDCEEALKNTKGLTLKHRRIRAEMKFEYSGTIDVQRIEADK